MMTTIAILIGGGVLERFPRLRCIFLEANGGWIVPFLERLDHHYEIFRWDVPQLKMKPSEYFKRQCWISFDPDESLLKAHRRAPAGRRRPHHLGVATIRTPTPRSPASSTSCARRWRGSSARQAGAHLRAERGRSVQPAAGLRRRDRSICGPATGARGQTVTGTRPVTPSKLEQFFARAALFTAARSPSLALLVGAQQQARDASTRCTSSGPS